MRKLLLATVVAATTYAAIELLSLGVLLVANGMKPSVFVPDFGGRYFSDLEDSDLREYFAGDYDALLGWDHKPLTEESSRNCLGETWTQSFAADGSRSMPTEFETFSVSSYGDSYIKGGDINNDQTWQYRLSTALGVGVKNYAVGAFDPYQAFLKIRRHIDQGNVYPVTILGINEQNVSRVVNLYRPFMYRNASARFSFKPGLACEGRDCVPVENLLRPDITTIEEVRELVLKAGEWDYWARVKPTLEYPWSFNLFKLARYALFSSTTGESEPLWLEPEGRAAMHFVVAEFRKAVLEADSAPVVLFVPTKPRKGVKPSYRDFKEEIAERYADITVVDTADSEFDVKKFKLKPSGACHPSAYGHAVIADAVREKVEGMLEERTVRSGDVEADASGSRR